MGSTETILFWKFVVPLAAKVFMDSDKLPIEAAKEAIEQVNNIKAGLNDAEEVLLAADEKQTESIISGLADLVTGVVGAPVALLAAFLELFGGKK